MTAPAPLGCPSCGAPISGEPACASCGLPLTGPLAYRLWQVDQQLQAMRQGQRALEAERVSLLDRLRSGETVAAPVLTPPPAWPGAAVPLQRKESSPQQVQNTLLTLGAILLAGAGIVFTAVTYRHLGVVGRALVLLTLTAAAAWAPTRLLPRGLTASAESVAAVAVVLAVLDAYALRRAGIGDALDGGTFWSGATSVLALLLALYAWFVPIRVPRWAAASMAQLPLPIALGQLDADSDVASAALGLQAGLDLVVAARARLTQDVQVLLGAFGALLSAVTVMVGVDAIHQHQRGAWAGFAVLAAVAALASWQLTSTAARDLAGLAVVPLLAVGAWAAARPDLTSTQEPLVLVAVAVLGLQVVGLLPRDRRLGAAGGALAVSAVSVVVEAEAVLQAVAGPFTWLGDPWTRTADSARGALAAPDAFFGWDGTVVTLVVLAGAALAVVTAGLVLDRVVPSLVPAGVLLVLTGMTLPLGFATSYHDALFLLLVVAGVLTSVGLALLARVRLVALASVASGVCTGLLAAAWSSADENGTLTVLAIVAILCAALSLALPGVPTGLALLLGAAELAAVGAHQGLAADQVGGLLLAAVGACAVLGLVLRDHHRLGAEVAGAGVAVAAVACAAEDPGWLSWTLAGAGLAALVVSVRPDRRAVGLVGGLLLSGSSWVRLADAGVHAPEPYVAPLATAALVAGWFRRRSHPTASSWEAYGTALTLALLPSLFRSFGDDTPTRGLLLLVACVSLLLIGAATRQQAPLALGAVVGVVNALWLLGPYANALPRWLLLGGLGLLLVVLGATYEARLRDVRRLRASFDAFA
jgi:hypothetical protein